MNLSETNGNVGAIIFAVCTGLVVGSIATMAVYTYAQGHSTHTNPSSGGVDRISKKVPEKLSLSREKGGVYFGEAYAKGNVCGKPQTVDGHVLVMGYTGCGKTSAIVNPTVETSEGFGVYLDIKGTLPEHWNRLKRRSGKNLLILDPYNSDRGNCWYDPFALSQHHPDQKVEYISMLAQALIPERSGDHNQIWTLFAQAFLTGALLYYFNKGESFVNALGLINDRSVTETVDIISGSDDLLAKSCMANIRDMKAETVSSIGIELLTHLQMLASSDFIRNALCPSEGKTLLDWETLNGNRPFDTILVFPEEKLDVMSHVLRMIINQLINSLEHRKNRTYNDEELPPVLIMLDEFPRLGNIRALKNGLTTLRSRGVTMVVIVQSLASLDDIYGEHVARVICENCTYKVILGSTDVKSQDSIASLIGTDEVLKESTSESISASSAPSLGISKSKNYSQSRELRIQPHELHALNDVILHTPEGVFRVRKRIVPSGCSIYTRENSKK